MKDLVFFCFETMQNETKSLVRTKQNEQNKIRANRSYMEEKASGDPKVLSPTHVIAT